MGTEAQGKIFRHKSPSLWDLNHNDSNMVTDATASQNDKATEVFRKEFHGYAKMVAADYLEHSLLFGEVQRYLKEQGTKLRILDLGCGDAGNLAKLLSNVSEAVASYTGVDMSDSALSTALPLMQEAVGKDAAVVFHLSDMLSYLRNVRGSYDVVIAAFALHHLTSEDKQETLKEIKRCLTADGVFLMVDPMRRKGETLKAYRQRATEVGETWVQMGKEQQENFIKHMQDYDIVEEQAFFEDGSKDAGFSRLEVLCRGQKGLQSCVTAMHA